MKALCTDGRIESLAIRDLPLPEPGRGEVRVRVRASALNPADQKVLSGQLVGNILHGKQRPVVTGWDVAGTVDAKGPEADLAIGDEVFGFLDYGRRTKRGAFAEAVVIRAASLAKRPASLTPAQAAALATGGVTALQMLRDKCDVKRGQRVLVVGAAGGVGSLAVSIAAKLGATVTAVCSAGAADFVRTLGATAVVERGKEDSLRYVERFQAILDTASASSFGKMQHLLAPGGTYIPTLPGPGLLLSMALARVNGKRAAFLTATSRRADLEELAALAAAGMKVPIDSTFPVRDVGAALARLAKGGMKGRVVIAVEDGF